MPNARQFYSSKETSSHGSVKTASLTRSQLTTSILVFHSGELQTSLLVKGDVYSQKR